MQVRRYAKRSFSALRLQCAWRRVAAKHSFDTRVNALDVIQRSMRRMLGALAFERERQRRENEVRLTRPKNVSLLRPVFIFVSARRPFMKLLSRLLLCPTVIRVFLPALTSPSSIVRLQST